MCNSWVTQVAPKILTRQQPALETVDRVASAALMTIF